MKISVAVRQKFHGFNLAQEIHNHSNLHKLYTSYYGKFLGKDNAKGLSIEPKHISTNWTSAFLTYIFKKNTYEVDDLFGKWVASKIGEEDVIITWGIQALPIIKRAKQLGIKVILERGSAHAVEQHDILKYEFEKYGLNTLELSKSFSAQRMERELLEYELADIISIPSKFVENSFIKHNIDKKKLFVNNYGVDLSRFTFSPVSHSCFRVIYVGNMTLQKGVHYLIKAFSELNLFNAELWLIGKMYDEITPFLNKNSKKIIHVPPVPQEKLNDYYNQSDVFSINSIQEGLAMVQLQAMACGLPLICSVNTGGEDLIEDGKEGFIIPIRCIESLKSKILVLYHNRELCKRMGTAAHEKIRTGFSWEAYGNRTVSKIKKIV